MPYNYLYFFLEHLLTFHSNYIINILDHHVYPHRFFTYPFHAVTTSARGDNMYTPSTATFCLICLLLLCGCDSDSQPLTIVPPSSDGTGTSTPQPTLNDNPDTIAEGFGISANTISLSFYTELIQAGWDKSFPLVFFRDTSGVLVIIPFDKTNDPEYSTGRNPLFTINMAADFKIDSTDAVE